MSKRAETGPMKFGDDWPGVFIRGDNALAFAMDLEALLEAHPPSWASSVWGLLEVLRGCHVTAEPEAQEAVLK